MIKKVPLIKYFTIALLFMMGCASTMYSISDNTDVFTGDRIVRMDNNTTSSKALFDIPFEINLIFLPNDSSLAIELVYRADDWIFIKNEKSLRFLTDNELIELSTFNPSRDIELGRINETALYPIRHDDLKLIFNSDKVKVRVYGEKGYTESEFTQKNKDRFKRFYNTYLQ
ncbi:MAG: hypothetical protein RIE52_12165 [Balneola sp.]